MRRSIAVFDGRGALAVSEAATLKGTGLKTRHYRARSHFPVSANDRGANSGLVFTEGDGRWIRESLGLHIHFHPLLIVVLHIEFALEFVEGKEQEFADEGQVGGVARRDAVLSDGFEELAEGEVDVGGGHEPASESGGEFGAELVRFDDLALGASVEGA